MKLLVAGGAQIDAGKTTFSVGLLARTGAVGYKPRAGNDYWYSHDDVREAAAEGTLYGKDARRLAAATPGDVEPAEINPIHRLWQPLPGGTGSILDQDGREFLLDRAGDTYVHNATTDLPDLVRESFPVEDAIAVDSLAAFNDVMERHHRPAQDAVADRIADEPLAVVESYGDIARPIQSLSHDAVAVVEPRRVRIYEGERYDKGCSVASGAPSPQEGTLEERVGDVSELIDPVDALELPPLSKSEQRDPTTVAEAYDDAYEALLSVAGQ